MIMTGFDYTAYLCYFQQKCCKMLPLTKPTLTVFGHRFARYIS